MGGNTIFVADTEKLEIYGTLPVKDRDAFWQTALENLLRGENLPEGYQVSVKSIPTTFDLIPVSRSIVLDKADDDHEVVFNGVGTFTFSKDGLEVTRHGISSNETYADLQNGSLASRFGIKNAAPWGTVVIAADGTVVHLNGPELLGSFNVETLEEKIASTELVEKIVKENGLKIEIPHFVAASIYGSDDFKVAGGVYIRPRIATVEMVMANKLSREAIMTLRHIHYRAIRDLMDNHILNPQLHFGNRGWAVRGSETVAYLSDWEDLMYTIDFDDSVEVPLERQSFDHVPVTALEKARIYSMIKAISMDLGTLMCDPAKVKKWDELIQNDIILALVAGFYRKNRVSDVQQKFKSDVEKWEKTLGVSYEKMVRRFAESLKGMALGTANLPAGGMDAFYQLHHFFENELSTFVALVLVKEIEEEKTKKKRKRH